MNTIKGQQNLFVEAGPFEKALSPDYSVLPLPLSKFFPTVYVSVNLEKSDALVIALGKG